MKSPFKFLDAYDRQDKEIFFGRAEEIDQLYTLVFQTKLLLVYGQSGTGKSSLIQCGLANRFKPTDWFELFVRRKDNINASLNNEIRRHATTSIANKATVSEAIHSLYLDHLRPVYLIFDQFEELFILGSREEQQSFIRTIAALLRSEVACKIIFVMREEYIAMLYDCEKLVPSLFNKRFRVEPMSHHNVQQVITGTTGAFGIKLEKGDATAQQIINNLGDQRAGVQLSYLQVYLDKLYREATKTAVKDETPVMFSEQLVQRTGALGDVMADFLEEQTASIQRELSAKYPQTSANTVQQTLEEFATLEGTKQPVSQEELSTRLELPDGVVKECLVLLENSRILRNIEGMYELAHDTLAGRIADKRSVERKNLLKVQKLIRDRYSVFEQTKTYLSKEELAFSNPHLTQLNLSEQEFTFVRRSERLVKRHHLKQLSLIIGSMFLLMSLFGYYYLDKQRRSIEARYTKDLSSANDSLTSMEKAASAAADAAEKKLFELNFYLKTDLETLPKSSVVRARALKRLKDYIPEAPEFREPISFSEKNREDLSLSEAIIIHDNAFSLALLKRFMPRANELSIRKFIFSFNSSVYAKSINSPRRFAAYLAVVAVLSDEFNYMEVSYDYSKDSLGIRFPSIRNVDSLQIYAHNPKKTANRLYANQSGNGGESSGDGWRYRARGLIKMWSRDRYLKYSSYSGYDLIGHPEWLVNVDVATAISCISWVKVLRDNQINTFADKRDFAAIADVITPYARYDIKDVKRKMMESYDKCCTLLGVD